jgi:glycosyltransferase involved in cell wall biosynthesis
VATRWCDTVIVANEFDRELALANHLVPPSKLLCIANGIDLETVDATPASPEIHSSLGVSRNGQVIGVMARLFPQKGIEYFLQALPEIIRQRPRTQAVIIGEGPLRPSLEAMTLELGLGSVVRFCGFRSDWIGALRALDVFVLPSLWEGLPITLLGAMATNRPIVASAIKGVTDVCGADPVAHLVPPRDSAQLADAVLRFLKDPECARNFGEAARRRVEEKYSDTKTSEEFWSVYAALLQKTGQLQPAPEGEVALANHMAEPVLDFANHRAMARH